jgi:hypothetical protein
MVFSVLFLLLGSHEKKMGFAIDFRSSMRWSAEERKEQTKNVPFVPAAKKLQQGDSVLRFLADKYIWIFLTHNRGDVPQATQEKYLQNK